MAKEKLLLINLNEEKTKKISEIISSNTSRKILDYLADNDDTEANISKNLEIPISTVHYHLQKLIEAKLVVVEEFHYSQKGREINHYKLANKYIIIAPKKVSGIKRALTNILPVALIVLGISAIIKFITGFSSFGGLSAPIAEKAVEESAVFGAERLADTAAPAMAEGANEIVNQTAVVSSQPDIALWFLIGSFATILIYLIIMTIKEWVKNK